MKFLALVLASFCVLGSAADALRPNILYFYVDDMGWGSIGPNGQAERRTKNLPNVKTPNIDRLAAEGINFTRAYGCTVCSPARSSQQTGFHQGHTFADRNDPDNAKKAIRRDDVTMGDALSEAGYETGYWGKWGYGGSKDMKNPEILNVQTLPTSHGYRHALVELHHVRAHTFFQPTLWSAPSSAKGGLELVPNSMSKYMGNAMYPAQPSNHADPKYPVVGYCDDAYAFATLDFVRTQAKSYRKDGKPFFGLLAVQIPHAPFDEIAKLPGWESAYADDPHFEKLAKQSQQWAAMVTRIDAHFGNILAALDDPNGDGDDADSVANDTLVIFMSDNGGPGGKNNTELDANGGLSGVKGSISEGGIRVPAVMRWPGKIKPGTVNDRPVDVSDLLPTFCELAGVKTPVGLDGVSIAPLLTGAGEQRKREFLIHEAGKSSSIIRGKDKLVRTPKGLQLYDLDVDRAEKINLAGKNKKLVNELEALLLGERVDEPRGFANTYHKWAAGIRGKNSSVADPDNWSDYVYENEGIVYQEDKGAPGASWIADFRHRSKLVGSVKIDNGLEFLGVEVSGATQFEIVIGPKGNLSGRNEVRFSDNATLTLKGGKVSSLRWIEVGEGALIKGEGQIDGTLYNKGEVKLATNKRGEAMRIHVSKDYVESIGAGFTIPVTGAGISELAVAGKAKLAGQLRLEIEEGVVSRMGESLRVLTASEIEGRFLNPDEIVESRDGRRFKISYTDRAVFITQEADTDLTLN